jgi:hypothetical protein
MKKILEQKRVFSARHIISIISLSFLSLGLFACYTLEVPKPKGADDTLLVICVDKNLGGRSEYFFYLELKIPTIEKPVKIRGQNFIIIRGLKPGDYKPESLLEFYDPPEGWRAMGSDYPPRSRPISVQFVMKPGCITIFPLKFVYSVTYSSDRAHSEWTMVPTGPADKDRFVKEVGKSDFFPLWKME